VEDHPLPRLQLVEAGPEVFAAGFLSEAQSGETLGRNGREIGLVERWAPEVLIDTFAPGATAEIGLRAKRLREPLHSWPK
jgi:hypothetical protein